MQILSLCIGKAGSQSGLIVPGFLAFIMLLLFWWNSFLFQRRWYKDRGWYCWRGYFTGHTNMSTPVCIMYKEIFDMSSVSSKVPQKHQHSFFIPYRPCLRCIDCAQTWPHVLNEKATAFHLGFPLLLVPLISLALNLLSTFKSVVSQPHSKMKRRRLMRNPPLPLPPLPSHPSPYPHPPFGSSIIRIVPFQLKWMLLKPISIDWKISH